MLLRGSEAADTLMDAKGPHTTALQNVDVS